LSIDKQEKLEFLRNQAGKLSKSPGVYLMKNKSGTIIYVGKAKSLKNRVLSYFIGVEMHEPKTAKLVSHIYDFDFIVTGSELDALVLENSLIKQHNPKYNIKLKDNTGYNYVKITNGDYPRITYTLNNDDKDAEYIGPYTAGFRIWNTVEETCRIFMLPSCSKKFPQEFRKSRPCLNYQINRCIGLCKGNMPKDEYKSLVKSAIDYIEGGAKGSIDRLTAEMEAASEKLDFETAAKLRNRIFTIQKAKDRQTIFTDKTNDFDVIGSALDTELFAVTIVKYRDGRLVDKENFFIGDEYNFGQMLSDFLTEYYNPERLSASLPDEILTEDDFEDRELLEKYFSELRGKKVKFTVPKRGDNLMYIMFAKNNAREYLALKVGRTAKELGALEELAKLLGLTKPPLYIESYDISNIGDMGKVGGMVVYKNGKPFKANYRKFNIKDVMGQDDYACMREVLHRRFTKHKDMTADNAFSTLPDLILLDGGIGHVSTVQKVLDEFGLDIKLFGMVKDEKHRTRAIASDGGEISVAANKQVFGLLTNIQDEVHRFSASFGRAVHAKKSYELILTDFKGIGEKKSTAILKHFKTKKAIKEATVEELSEIAKISINQAILYKKHIEENL
jgi:excinuclease ABC subunit C